MIMTAQGGLVGWAEQSARRRAGSPAAKGLVPGRLRFVFYGRVSTEDWQDPVTSRARQREQAEMLVRGHGRSWGSSSMSGRAGRWRGRGVRRPPPWSPGWPTRPGLGRGRDRGVRAGVLRQPVRGDGAAVRALRRAAVDAGGRRPGRLRLRARRADDDHAGLSSKREVTRTSIRVRTAMAVQTRSRAATSAAGRLTGTGWPMPGRTRTRRTPRGDGGRTAWIRIRRPRMWCGGYSPSAWRAFASRGSRGR